MDLFWLAVVLYISWRCCSQREYWRIVIGSSRSPSTGRVGLRSASSSPNDGLLATFVYDRHVA